jgi:hypothetical protein
LSVLMIAAGMLVAIVVMMTQLRGMTYANLLAALLLATAAGRLIEPGSLATMARFMAVAVLPVLCIFAVSAVIGRPPSEVPPASQAPVDINAPLIPSGWEEACAARGMFDALASQPRGLVLSHIDLGPALLLQTNHDVVMAPYHRADLGIVAGMTWMNLPVSEAHDTLKKAKVTYLADCKVAPFFAPERGVPVLRDVMIGAQSVRWLEEIPAPRNSALRFWRVLP